MYLPRRQAAQDVAGTSEYQVFASRCIAKRDAYNSHHSRYRPSEMMRVRRTVVRPSKKARIRQWLKKDVQTREKLDNATYPHAIFVQNVDRWNVGNM